MGATPSHENEVPTEDPDEDSDDDEVIKMQNGRFRVSVVFFVELLTF